LVDNRLIKLKILDDVAELYQDYDICFCNVHKKHQFAELYHMKVFTTVNQAQEAQPDNQEESKVKSSMPLEFLSMIEKPDDDFKVFTMTWNMGHAQQAAFRDQPDLVFKNIHKYDLVAICA